MSGRRRAGQPRSQYGWTPRARGLAVGGPFPPVPPTRDCCPASAAATSGNSLCVNRVEGGGDGGLIATQGGGRAGAGGAWP